MSHLDFILHALNGIQRKWVYLEPIFGRGSLPNEAKRFKSVDEDFRDIMRNVEADPKLFGLVDPHVHRDIRRTLETMLDQLDRCQKALSDFLEEKRSAFPRFYFIGDDDLLEILGQAKNPAVIQSHLKKLFAGIFSVKFSEGDASIIAMCSLEGEVVPLAEPVPVSDTVEVWLALLNTQMRATLVQLVANTIGSRLNIAATPSQVLDLAERVIQDLPDRRSGGGGGGNCSAPSSARSSGRRSASRSAALRVGKYKLVIGTPGASLTPMPEHVTADAATEMAASMAGSRALIKPPASGIPAPNQTFSVQHWRPGVPISEPASATRSGTRL